MNDQPDLVLLIGGSSAGRYAPWYPGARRIYASKPYQPCRCDDALAKWERLPEESYRVMHIMAFGTVGRFAVWSGMKDSEILDELLRNYRPA